MTYKKINERIQNTQILYITINLTNEVTPYSDFITGNSSVYVRNKNQGEYTKNRHCEKVPLRIRM